MGDALDILNSAWSAIFPDTKLGLSLEDFEAEYCLDLALPLYGESLWGGHPVAMSKPYRHAASQSQIEKRTDELQQTPPFSGSSVEELLNCAFSNLLFSGDNHYDSENVIQSDNVFKSREIFYSRAIHQSKKVVFSGDSIGLENAAACDSSGYSQFVIRAIDSINCSRCFDIYQSGKCSGCLFVSNCYNLHDCILCTNLRSKRYCIGNMQFTEANYRKLRKEIEVALVFEGFRPMYQLAGSTLKEIRDDSR